MTKTRNTYLALLAVLLSPMAAHADTILLTATIRDFNDTHSDFENFIGGLETGAVKTTLGADGKPVYNAPNSSQFHGATAFDQWYNDVAGVNMTTTKMLTADDSASTGTFVFSDNLFFPIDDELFGNQGRLHNFHFTSEIHTTFSYLGGETFSFTGDDDVWVFINDLLAVDLGGVHGAISGSVDLDTSAAALGISAGSNYTLDIFHAERHTSASNFSFATTIALVDAPVSVPEPGTLALLGLGLFGMGLARRKKA